MGKGTIMPMDRLKSICSDIGLRNVRTYIHSGNIIFESELSEKGLVEQFEQTLQMREKKYILVIIRTGKNLDSIITRNPFPNAKPAQIEVMFFTKPVPIDLMKRAEVLGPEEVKISGRDIYIHFPNGVGRSKLKLPSMQQQGTVRNINTVTKLAALIS